MQTQGHQQSQQDLGIVEHGLFDIECLPIPFEVLLFLLLLGILMVLEYLVNSK